MASRTMPTMAIASNHQVSHHARCLKSELSQLAHEEKSILTLVTMPE